MPPSSRGLPVLKTLIRFETDRKDAGGKSPRWVPRILSPPLSWGPENCLQTHRLSVTAGTRDNGRQGCGKDSLIQKTTEDTQSGCSDQSNQDTFESDQGP